MAFMDKVKELGRKISESGTIVEEIKTKAKELNKMHTKSVLKKVILGFLMKIFKSLANITQN